MAEKNDDKNASWREKYFDALDKQEQQEKIAAAQQELLRRALVRVSVSADGQDDALDAILAQLRERMRGTGDIKSLISRLDEAVLQFEQARDNNAQKIRQSLLDSLKPLQQLALSRGVKKDIKQYLVQLPEQSKKARMYPKLIQQLAAILQQAIKDIEQPKNGFWQKLLGKAGSPVIAKRDSDTAQNDNAENQSAENVTMLGAQQNKTKNMEQTKSIEKNYAEIDAELAAASDLIEKQQQLSAELPPLVIDKVSQILNQLLTSFENETAIAKKIHAIRTDISAQITAAGLIQALEDVRDLVLQAKLSANAAFAAYLKNVNQELAEIYGVVGGAIAADAGHQAAVKNMENTMAKSIVALETGVASATDLVQLKAQVNTQIDNIRHAFGHYQQSTQAQQQLSAQLDVLSGKLKSMELNAEKNQSLLEQQRYKALHDPLTSLPNREFYVERSAYEYQRWQRYERPLTLAIFDIDHFKKVNDGYGHQAGDKVLKVIGSAIATRLREVDFFCRFGGEEFVAIMPETALADALLVVNKIRVDIAKAAFNYKDQPLAITISIGATEFKTGDDWETAFARADKALYSAKLGGRNCAHTA
jgi:diguanylate cyclase